MAEIVREKGKEPRVISDYIAAKCMQKICDRVDPNFEVQINKEIEHLSELSEMGVTSHQIPDGVALYDFKNQVGLLYDVQSSPMIHTERKIIMGAANFIQQIIS